MGKKARLKKEALLAELKLERQEIERRAKERRAPIVATVRRVTIAAVLTVVLMYVGVVINDRIDESVAKEQGTQIP